MLIFLSCTPFYRANRWPFRSAISTLLSSEVFTASIYATLPSNIPNKVVKCSDKDPPWITPHVKTAIKRKQKVYREFCRWGRRDQDWTYVKHVRNETSKIILNAKEEYFERLGTLIRLDNLE